MRSHRFVLLLVVAVLLAGCGGDDADEAGTTPTPTVDLDVGGTGPATVAPTTAAPDPTPTPQPTQEEQGGRQTYTVEQGDTLSSIAQQFDTTVQDLVRVNDLDDPDTIFPGDELRIP